MNISDEQLNYIKLQQLLVEATKIIREVFLETWTNFSQSAWSDNPTDGVYFLNGEGKQIFNKAYASQKELLKEGNSAQWDISLFSLIFKYSPFKNNKKVENILSITEIRNHLNHVPTMSINSEKLNQFWSQLSQAMTLLGYIESEMDKLKAKIDALSSFQPNKMNQKNAADLKEKANQKFKNFEYKESIELYSSAILLENLTNNELAILYCNRSVAYLKLHENSSVSNKRDLCRALDDAKQSIILNPFWFKGYARLGLIYKEFNELEKSIEYYVKALALDPANEDIKNSLAIVKKTHSEQNRLAHLDEQMMPGTTEEKSSTIFYPRLAECYGEKKASSAELNNYMETNRKLLEKLDPALADVWQAHDYRDGSINCSKNYELAAQYYAKAAKKGNAEAFYNLALLTMNGLGKFKKFNDTFQNNQIFIIHIIFIYLNNLKFEYAIVLHIYTVNMHMTETF